MKVEFIQQAVDPLIIKALWSLIIPGHKKINKGLAEWLKW
jgi:hypothetical protein